MRLEWDDAKDCSNQKRHGLSFSEVTQLFHSSQDYLEIFDAAHSDAEDRFIAIGEIDREIAVVVYMEREEGLIRIIGAPSLQGWSRNATESIWINTDERHSRDFG